VFDNLIESKPKKRALKDRLPGTMLSVAFHGGIIYAAVIATMKIHEATTNTAADTTVVFLQQKEQPKEPPPPKIASLNPPPKGFQNLSAPVDIPTKIPPVDLNQHFNPKDYSGIGVEGGVANGVTGGTGPVDLNQIFSEAAVDEPPVRLSGPPPYYPPLLKDAGVQGSVTLRFVIKPDGHADPSSITVVSSTNKAFEDPAKNMILGSVFRPGRLHGRPVSVLVEQAVSFTLTK
jgi:periplasmic protein TonB